MASVKNVEVSGLASSIYRSGYPMLSTAPTEEEFQKQVSDIAYDIENGYSVSNAHITRAAKLARASGGGHDQFLTGINVTFDLCVSNKVWVEAERYTFLNFISSMSTMHRASLFEISESCNTRVHPTVLSVCNTLQERYNSIDGEAHPEEKKEAYLDLLYNLPSGFELMAGMTTNYRCLKNIHAQRRRHRLPDWHIVCDWIESLPLAAMLIY